MRRILLVVVPLLAALLAATASATEFRLIVDRPVDTSPGNATSPVTLRFTAAATDSCATAATCRTRSAFALTVSPCPADLTSCFGTEAFYFQNRDAVSIFTPIRLELDPNQQYTVSGEWTLEQFMDDGSGCIAVRCNFTQSFQQTFLLADLVGARSTNWSALKARW